MDIKDGMCRFHEFLLRIGTMSLHFYCPHGKKKSFSQPDEEWENQWHRKTESYRYVLDYIDDQLLETALKSLCQIGKLVEEQIGDRAYVTPGHIAPPFPPDNPSILLVLENLMGFSIANMDIKDGMCRFHEFLKKLYDFGLSQQQATKLVSQYGLKICAEIQQNPYRLIGEIRGYSFACLGL